MKEKLAALDQEKAKFRQGGGAAEVEKQHAKGRLTARERINKLLDPGSFHEIDLLSSSAQSSFEPSAVAPADGVIVGSGRVNGRPIFIWAQDATVLGGSIGVNHARKITTVMLMALQARVPIVGIVDSIGERVEDSVDYPRFYSLESMCKTQVSSSGVIPQIMLVMGPCPGSLALSTNLADVTFLVRKTSYMHAVPLPEGKNGEEVGEAWMHAKKTGCCDVMAENDEECLAKCKQLLSYLPSHNKEKAPRKDTGDRPDRREEELLELVPLDESRPFSMFRLISLIVDNGEYFELKHYWAANLIVCLARLNGETVGIIANNPQFMGGCMNLDASDKMARFVRFCNAFNIPLIWLADCPAFLPAVEEEIRGIIRHGSKVIMANALATVPMITIIIRKLYGGGGLAMPGARLGGDAFVAWPSLTRGLMGPEGAVAILYRKELVSIEDKAKRDERTKVLVADIRGKLASQQLKSVQEFLDPRDTRPFLIELFDTMKNKQRELPGRKHDNFRL
ncbi:MAG: carboxyl transferase domain-containing protein [Dehalococcoidales bacterium]|nr:carboxyl transferase domain-containing protein [Dehalococcoidales bacterium]